MIERQRKTLPGIGPINLLAAGALPISERIMQSEVVGKIDPKQVDLDIGEFAGRVEAEKMKYMLRTALVIRTIEGFGLNEFIKRIEVVDPLSRDSDGQTYHLIEDNYGSQYRIYIDPKKKVATPGLDEKNRVLLQVGEETHYLFKISFFR